MDYNYSDLNLKTNTDSITFDFQGKQIEIFRYLPLEYKYDIIMISLNEAAEVGIYNQLKLDAFFHINLFLSYVKNINFTKAELSDKIKLYNEIYSSGLFEQFLVTIDDEEYNTCYDVLEKMAKLKMSYNNAIGAVIKQLVEELPKRTEDIATIIQNLDEEKIEQIKDIAALMTEKDKKKLN